MAFADRAGLPAPGPDLLETVVANAPIVLFATDADGVITLSRGRALDALGLAQDELVGQSAFDLYRNEPAVAESMRRALTGETVVSRLDLDGTWHETRFAPVLDADGRVTGLLGVATDITDRVHLEQEQREHALFDHVTGLPNRIWLRDHVEALIAAEAVRPFALATVGLDRFREVNSTYGFQYGDRVLRLVGERLRKLVGETGVVARVGGDEFAIVQPAGSLEVSFSAGAEALLAELAAPFVVEEEPIAVEGSMGVAFYPGHGEDTDLLLRRADTAMRVAKESALPLVTYRPERDEVRINNVRLLAELRQSLAADHLLFHYQPRVEIASGRVTGVEALIRWDHPERGLLPPSDFIPLSERSGLTRELLPWTVNTAARQARHWVRSGLELPIAVNLSARAFQDRRLPEQLGSLLAMWGLAEGQLEIEITESALMVDVERAVGVCERLRALGMRIAIDDFGVGHSPLVYLKRLGPYAIKIDRAFVGDMTADPDHEAIVRYIVELARRLGIRTVAEGVEDAATLERLAALGCDEAQGYYLSRPLPAVELETWVRDRLGAGGDSARRDSSVA